MQCDRVIRLADGHALLKRGRRDTANFQGVGDQSDAHLPLIVLLANWNYFSSAGVVADPMPSTSATPTSGHMVIEIGKDRRVIVDAGVDAAALARVLAILERR